MMRKDRMAWSIYTIFVINCLLGVTLAADECEKVGLRCNKDNTKVEYCAKIGESPAYVVDTCTPPKKCVDEDGRVGCMNPQDNKLRFMCSDEGEFPDPGNCGQTYICKANDPNPSEVCVCPGGNFVYPAPGLFCVPGECPRNNITCTEGAYGHFTLKPNGPKTSYYYYCRSSKVVQVFENVEPLDNAKKFAAVTLDMKNGKDCRLYKNDSPTEETTSSGSTSSPATETTSSGSTSSPATETTSSGSTSSPATETTSSGSTSSQATETTSSGSTSSQATETTSSGSTSSQATNTTPTPTVPPDNKPICKSNGELYPTECDCDYYKCDQKLKPVRRTCADGLRYHEKYKRCVFGECDESKCIHRPPKRFTH